MGDDLTAKVIGAAIEVHRILGPGLLESIYEEANCREFELRNIPFKRQVSINVIYKDRPIQGQRIDLLVFDQIVVEIKSVRELPEFATAQVLSYLRGTGLKSGLLINFSESRLANGIKRISL